MLVRDELPQQIGPVEVGAVLARYDGNVYAANREATVVQVNHRLYKEREKNISSKLLNKANLFLKKF